MEVIRPESIKGILRVAEEYNELYHLPRPGSNSEYRAFYRGQENYLWTVQPSICRAKGSIDERSVFEDFRNEIKEKETLFDKIAYVQHYMTGTRFVDFTSSLDVALYFACKDTSTTGKDGAVYIWSYDPHISNWVDTTIMMEIISMEHEGYISIKEFSDILRKKYGDRMTSSFPRPSLLDLSLMGYLDYGFMVVPREYNNNERMKRQKGAFFICGVEFTKPIETNDRYESNAGKNVFIAHSVSVPEDLRNGNRLIKCIIANKLKPIVIDYLKTKGITEDYLMVKNEERVNRL